MTLSESDDQLADGQSDQRAPQHRVNEAIAGGVDKQDDGCCQGGEADVRAGSGDAHAARHRQVEIVVIDRQLGRERIANADVETGSEEYPVAAEATARDTVSTVVRLSTKNSPRRRNSARRTSISRSSAVPSEPI